jgi:4-amino-4-deoxy-L-arabinose transferase-like glycosyltransferase
MIRNALTRRELIAVGALLLAGLAVRMAVRHDGYVFAGGDSYGYVALADQLHDDGRYALAPPPAPLYWARPPLYPLFVALVKSGARAEPSGGDGWRRITLAQVWLDVLVTGLCVWAIGRRLAGRRAGLIALGLVMFSPFTIAQTSTALTETVATALSTAALTALLLLERRRIGALVAGALIGLAALVRPDGLLLTLALPAAWLLERSWRERAILAALSLVGFSVAFAPWPIRNQVRFANPHPFGARVGHNSTPIEHFAGEQHFLASFGKSWHEFDAGTSCVLDGICGPIPLDFLPGAAATEEEHDEVHALSARRMREGLTPAVSDAFEAAARARARAHPIRVFVALPLARAASMWLSGYDEVLKKPPLPRLRRYYEPTLPVIAFCLALAIVVGSIALAAFGRTRARSLVLISAIVGRTAVLSLLFYCMPRYVREVQPIGYALAAAGLVELARWRGRRRAGTIRAA